MSKPAGKRADRHTRARSLGASDFLSFVHDWGHPEWLIVAVEAPLEAVAAACVASAPATRRWENVPIRSQRGNDDEFQDLIAVVQPKECRWTIVLRLLCLPLTEEDIAEGLEEARKLSSTLRTRALAFFGEDTSYAMEFQLYAKGKPGGKQSWESQEDPEDSAFAKLGLYLPACYPWRDGAAVGLVVDAASEGRIKRADLLD